jgi:hypothetical protein
MDGELEDSLKIVSVLSEQIGKLSYSYNQVMGATQFLNLINAAHDSQLKSSLKLAKELEECIDDLTDILEDNIKVVEEGQKKQRKNAQPIGEDRIEQTAEQVTEKEL